MPKPYKLPELILKYTLAATLLVVPLYPKFPFISIPGTFVSIRLEDIILGFLALIILWLVVSDFEVFIKDNLNKTIILFLSIGLLSAVSGIIITRTVVPLIGLLHWLRRVEYIIPLIAAVYLFKLDKNNLSYFLNILLIEIALIFFYGVGQRYFGWPIIVTQNEEYSKGVALRFLAGSHLNSTFAGHYDLATYLVLTLPIVISMHTIFRNNIKKLFTGSIFLMGLWLLVMSASRISLVSYLVATTTTLLIRKSYKLIPLVIIISILFTGFSSNLLLRYGRIIEVLKARYESLELSSLTPIATSHAAVDLGIKKTAVTPTPTPVPVLEDRSSNIRFNVEWPRAIRAFKKNPILGTGYSSITLATDNDYLRLLGEVGSLGFITFSLLIIIIIYKLLIVFPFKKPFTSLESAYLAGIAGSFPGIFINAVFIDIFEASKFAIIYWMLIGIAVGLVDSQKNEQNI